MHIEQAQAYLQELLKLVIRCEGSDLFLTADFPPAVKVDGKLGKVSPHALRPADTQGLARALMTEQQWQDFERTRECNFAVPAPDQGRFRVSAFVQQGHVGLVLRRIPPNLPNLDALGLPVVLKDLAMAPRGLCILVGATGAGKSTTLAAMLDWRNQHSSGHILTVEEPIEFVHPHKNCIVTQREVGLDTDNWGVALKNSLRQAPDVVLMGEIRDREGIEHAMAFAETGHLCLATLHANNANQAIDRILHLFPEDRRDQVLMDLSFNLRAVVSQRLVPRQDPAQGRLAVVEVMLNSPLIADLIFKGDLTSIKEAMRKSEPRGMQTFDQALFAAYEAGQISLEEALRHADSVNDLRLQIKLNGQRVAQEAEDRGAAGVGPHLEIV